VSDDKKREHNVSVSFSHYSPEEVLDHDIVFVLSAAVICVKKNFHFAKSMGFKKVV